MLRIYQVPIIRVVSRPPFQKKINKNRTRTTSKLHSTVSTDDSTTVVSALCHGTLTYIPRFTLSDFLVFSRTGCSLACCTTQLLPWSQYPWHRYRRPTTAHHENARSSLLFPRRYVVWLSTGRSCSLALVFAFRN
jgi:hypothetical protein